MAGIKNFLQQLDAANAQNQSYQKQLEEVQKSVSGANVYTPTYQQSTLAQPIYTPSASSTSNWSPTNTISPSSSSSTAVWTPPTGIPELLAVANAPASGISNLPISGGK